MKVLIAHNAYPNYGGEDTVVSNEINMLKNNGIEVVPYIVPTEDTGLMNLLRCGLSSIWNPFSSRKLSSILNEEMPDIVHFHNTFPLLSPSVFATCHAAKVPAVQTIHNYRHICPAGGFFREGNICEECIGKKFPLPALKHACYRNSRMATLAPSMTAYIQRMRDSFVKDIDTLIALNQFGKNKLIEGGIPEEKICIKPNFSPDARCVIESGKDRKHLSFCFTGRLGQDKGIQVLLEAWEQLIGELKSMGILNNELPTLTIAGEGECQPQVEASAQKDHSINYVGHLTHAEAIQLIQNTDCMICPSIWYEGMPMTILEAFSLGKPVIASSIGALPEMIDHELNGWVFTPGQSSALKECLAAAIQTPELVHSYGKAAKNKWTRCYSEQANFGMLMKIYNSIICA